MRVVRSACAVVTLMGALFTVVSVLNGLDLWAGTGLLGILYLAIPAGAGVSCGVRAALVKVDRLGWALFSAGFLSYALGGVLDKLIYSRRDPVPYPSPADAFWIALYPLVIVGIWTMVRSRLEHRFSSLLDGIVVGAGVASVAALLVFPRITADATGSVAAVVTNFAYPLLDLTLCAAAMAAMAALGAWWNLLWVVLVNGFLAFTISDAWYLALIVNNTFTDYGANDVMFLLAIVAIALGSACPVSEPPPPDSGIRQSTSRSIVVPLLFALLPLGVLVVGALGSPASPLAVGLSIGALLALAVRTVLVMREVVALSDSRRLALTDSLTGLPNRRALYDLLAQPATPGLPGTAAVLILDLDRFKEINDGLGHQVGDEVLRQVATRLAAQVPPPGVMTRLGGDEMAIYAPSTDRGAAAQLAARLLEALEKPFTVDGSTLHVGGSIGITSFVPGTPIGRALAQADMAMYRAKSARTGVELYDDAQDTDTRAWDRLAIVEALRLALAAGQLSVAFQPIVEASTRQTRSVEALVRWTHPERGFIPPDVFLPLAEHAGLMPAVTRAMMNLSLDEARVLRDLGLDIAISMNVSASDLLDTGLEQDLASRLQVRGLPPSALKIEITESLLVDSDGRAGEFLAAVRGLGIELLVDDFGTGYSSMAYLHDLPVSTLKIDRAFTSRLSRDARTGVIVASTIDMAHQLGLSVVAEGVETEVEFEWLRSRGCDLIQGYLVSRPMPASQLHEWLTGGPVLSQPVEL